MPVETYECILSGKLAGQFVQTILHVGVDNDVSAAPFAVANAICVEFNGSAQLIEKFVDCLPEDYLMTSMRVRRVAPTGGPTQIYLQGNIDNYQGTRAGLIDVSSNCPLIIWLTTTNPSKTGRTFMPGVSESDIEEMRLDSALLAKLDLLGDYCVAGGTLASPAIDWKLHILRRASNVGNEVTNFRVSPIIGTQRRRQRPY
jgi:hypothetical protein